MCTMWGCKVTRWLLLLVLFPPALATAADNVEVGLLDDRAPYSDFSLWGRAEGALPELLNLLSRPGQLQFELKPASSLLQLETMLQERNIRMVLPPPFSTPPPGVLVSLPLLQQHWALITRNNRLPVYSHQKLNLNQQRILLLRNSPVGPKISAIWPNVFREEGLQLSEALKLLNAGAADGIVCDAALADMLVHNLYPGILSSVTLPDISNNQALWLSPGEEDLLKEINARIEALPPGDASSVTTRWLLNAALNEIHPINENTDGIIDSFAIIAGTMLLFLVAFLLSQILRRRRAEQDLLDALTYWQTLLNSIPTPLLVCNPVGKITHCNQTLLSSLQVSTDQVIDMTLEQFMTHNAMAPPLEHHEWVEAICSLSPQFSDRTLRIRGKMCEVVQWLAVYCDSRNVPQGLLIGWYDISERKRLERELEISSQEAINASREKSQFLARMSHEIRSPMNAILGILELEQQKQHTPTGSSLNIAYAASRQLLQIVGGVLDISKIEAGELKLQVQNGAIYPLLTQVVNTYSTLALQKGLQLESVLEIGQATHYRMDGTKLSQVLSNLLSNAIKYTKQGTIKLTVVGKPISTGTDSLTFRVQDSGPGIAAEMQERILQPYVQLDPDSPASTGLGLAICAQFLKLMGSRLHIQSTPGEGSCFSFSISLEKSPEQTTAGVPENKNRAEKPLHILVVDDQPANLVVMKLQLETLGHQVTTCDDGKQALQHLRQHAFDLLLTDCQMPLMTGYQLAQHHRQREQEDGGYLVIIGCTANAFSDEQKRCLESGMDAVLIKPLTLQDLRQVLSEQQQIRLDMAEIHAMTANQPQVMTTILDELQRTSEHDRQQLLGLSTWQSEQYKVLLHRQKGSFALAGFQAGVNLCKRMEEILQGDKEEDNTFPLRCLQLNALILRFIALLSSQKKGL
ncbi:Virulence sensor protein BvgS precursor [Serratia ficaria]|nr:Virulence sensor protein BvgS precursor [Serratia ficaria]